MGKKKKRVISSTGKNEQMLGKNVTHYGIAVYMV